MKATLVVFIGICLAAGICLSGDPGVTPALAAQAKASRQDKGYTGSVSCRECHEKFYKLWATSYHGLAMQPYTAEFARKALTPQEEDIVIGEYRYRAIIKSGTGYVLERGPEGVKKYPMAHALGGKNVYYLLTSMDRGRLQTLPVAYDVRKKEWFDTAASGVRHFPGHTDEPVNWKEWHYTFNTACYSCHVSQLSTYYDLKTDTYQTVWAEPGINCETCHGPAAEHNRVCKEAPKGEVPKDLKLTRGGKDFTVDQNNATCAPCHAKMVPITTTFKPGDRYFDHYGLATVDHPDFYPDGRDLGENYTYTLWRMSPCARSGKLDCLHCHTSSGRFRQKNDPNQACAPCHQKRVENAAAHTHHPVDSQGNKCISCHMPMTEFARMRRSDHSMLPPTPAATIAFKSPNACNLCHTDKDAAWADKYVREWRKRDYQAPVLHRAGLIDAARKRDWSRLPEMLAYVTSKDRDEIFATALIRLLSACNDERKWPAVREAMDDPSPLVRSAAVTALDLNPTRQSLDALLKATGDDYRLVRVRAAMALSSYPGTALKDQDRQRFELALSEAMDSLLSRPDHWTSHYNLGNFFLDRGDLPLALGAFETASKLEPRSILPLVNASMVYARAGENTKAEEMLRHALEIDPDSPEANFNMGLLKAEQNDPSSAEKHLRAVLTADPQMAEAAYNLGVLLAEDRAKEAMELIYQAFHTTPTPKYGYTLAFYMWQNKEPGAAAEMLRMVVRQWPYYGDAYLLLGGIYEEQGKTKEAEGLYREALSQEGLARPYRYRIQAKLKALESL